MAIRDLILAQEPTIALQDLKIQWTEMAGNVNDVINQFTLTRDGLLQGPDNTVASSISVSTTLSYGTRTVSITTSGKTITLPAINTNMIGQEWTVHQNVVGNVTIAPQGSNTIVLPTTDTSVTLYNKGNSLTFRVINGTSWGIV